MWATTKGHSTRDRPPPGVPRGFLAPRRMAKVTTGRQVHEGEQSTHPSRANDVARDSNDRVAADTRETADTRKRLRPDHPVVRAPKRGKFEDAARIAGCPRELALAEKEFEEGFYAETSKAGRDSLLRTFCKLAHAAGKTPFPLTVEVVRSVGATLKKAGYRSVANYFARARARNLELGFAPSESLRAYMKSAERRAERGLGPARKTASLEMDVLARAPRKRSLGIAGAPLFPRRVCAILTAYLMREIEGSAARIGAAELDHASQEATLSLPISTADFRGVGAKRTHGCCCAENPRICPFHLLQAQVKFAKKEAKRAGWKKRDLPDAPLFPTTDGTTFSKRGFAEAAGQIVEENENDAERIRRGGRPVLGHAPRPGGAKWLARAGIAKPVIQLFGRWGSDAILGYVEEEPLVAESATLAGRAAGAGTRDLTETREDILGARQQGAGTAELRDDLRRELQAEFAKMRGNLLAELLKEPPSPRGSAREYVINGASGVAHIVRAARDGAEPHELTTLCGRWKFGNAGATATRTWEIPALDAQCARCFARSLK